MKPADDREEVLFREARQWPKGPGRVQPRFSTRLGFTLNTIARMPLALANVDYTHARAQERDRAPHTHKRAHTHTRARARARARKQSCEKQGAAHSSVPRWPETRA